MSEVISPETLEIIQRTAVKAAGAEGKIDIFELPGEPPHIYGIVKPDGTLERVVADPATRNHKIVSLAEAILFANEKGNELESVIWFDRSGVVILLDDATRRDAARLTLTPTPQLALLQKIERDSQSFDQQEFRRLLRISLDGCRPDDALLNWVSDMRFRSEGEARGRLEHGRDSMGKDLEHEAMSDQGLCPEFIELSIRIFDDPARITRRKVRCSVEVLTKEQRFRLLPIPLAIHDAIEQELEELGEDLRKAVKCKVFRGTP